MSYTLKKKTKLKMVKKLSKIIRNGKSYIKVVGKEGKATEMPVENKESSKSKRPSDEELDW